MRPLGTSASEWPIIFVPVNCDEGEFWWNEDWQRKSKYTENTCPSATLSTTNLTYQIRARTRAAAVGSQRLTAWAMARPQVAALRRDDHPFKESCLLSVRFKFQNYVVLNGYRPKGRIREGKIWRKCKYMLRSNVIIPAIKKIAYGISRLSSTGNS
jgi:hypothetical protein